MCCWWKRLEIDEEMSGRKRCKGADAKDEERGLLVVGREEETIHAPLLKEKG
jgi:hypothetical protein